MIDAQALRLADRYPDVLVGHRVPLLTVGITRCALCHQVTRPGQGYGLREVIVGGGLLVYVAMHHDQCPDPLPPVPPDPIVGVTGPPQ